MSYEVYVSAVDFGRYYDVHVFNESFDRRRQLFLHSEPGEPVVFKEVEVEEGIRMSPSLSLPASLIGPLVEALTDHAPTKIDQTILDALDLERTRVDKLIDHVIAIA